MFSNLDTSLEICGLMLKMICYTLDTPLAPEAKVVRNPRLFTLQLDSDWLPQPQICGLLAGISHVILTN